MAALPRQKKLPGFKIVYSLALSALFIVILLFYMEVINEKPLLHQFLYLFGLSSLGVVIEWLSTNNKQSQAIDIANGEFKLLGITIKVSELEEVLYCQTKRFEHTLRFKFRDATYRDIEISAPDLIDDLRFYHFMVGNGLPVKMTDDTGRFFERT